MKGERGNRKLRTKSCTKLPKLYCPTANAKTKIERLLKLEGNITLLTGANNTYTFNTIDGSKKLALLEMADDGTIIINNYGYEGSQAHEVTHAAQYEDGKLIYVGNKTSFVPIVAGGFLEIEVEAYQTEYSISGEVPPSENGDVESVIDIDAEWVTGIYGYDKNGNKIYPYKEYGTRINPTQGVSPWKLEPQKLGF